MPFPRRAAAQKRDATSAPAALTPSAACEIMVAPALATVFPFQQRKDFPP